MLRTSVWIAASTSRLLRISRSPLRHACFVILLQLIKSRCYRVAPTKRLQVTPDPDDDIFLDWRR